MSRCLAFVRRSSPAKNAVSARAILSGSSIFYSGLLAAVFFGSDLPEALSQALTANGTTQPASGTYSTSASGTAGYGFSILNNGTINTTGNVTITTTGSSANGINVATTGGTVNLNNPTAITTSGSGANGIVLNSGRLTATAPVNITAAATAIVMSGGSVASMTGGSASGEGLGVPGIDVVDPATVGLGAFISQGVILSTSGAGTQFTGQNLNLFSQGASQVFAIQATTGSRVLLTGGSISGSGSQANTIDSNGAGTFLSLRDLSVTVRSGARTPAAVAVENLSTAELDNVTIVTNPGASEGVATLTGGTATVRNSNITTNGNANPLGEAGAGSVGARAFGLNANGTPSTIKIFDTTITTNGTLASGLESDNGGVIEMTGGSVTTNNAGAEGILATATSAAGASAVGRVTLNDVDVVATGDGIASFGGSSVISLTGSSVTTGSGLALHVRQNSGGVPANTIVTMDSSTITGAMTTDAVSTSTVSLGNGTQWNLTGNSNLTNLTNDSSRVDFSAPTADPTQLTSYKTLTAENYSGAGGTLRLNTYLGADGSPSDRLVVDGGTATGTTAVIAANVGGPGALTTGNGILVVDAINGATTAPGAFGPTLAVAGPYEYTMFRGSVDGTAPENWYLRSTLLPPPPPPPPPPPGPPSPPEPPSPPTPHYRQEVSLYAAIQPMAAIYGRHLIDTLHERVGEEEQLRGKPSASGRDTFNGAWGRILGHSGERDGDAGGIYGGAPEFDYDFWALQAGTDILRRERADGGRDHAGLYLAYGHGEVDVTHSLPLLNRSFTAGTDKFDAFTLGGYWTRFGGERDWYVDTVVQGTWYDVTTSSLRNTLIGFPDQDVSGFGFAASLEGGYPFALGAGWSLEPQAQLVYQAIDFDDFDDGAAQVRFANLDSLAGRLGARLARTWAISEVEQSSGIAIAPRQATVWGRVDLWHEFLADSQVSFSSADGFVPFSADLEESWIAFGIGASVEVAAKTTLYGNVNYETSFDGDSHGFDGKLGVRVNW